MMIWKESSKRLKGYFEGETMYRKYIKRWLDIILSFIAIIVLWPVMAVIAICVKVKLGSPVIFVQKRPGLNECIFKMYKFRSMMDMKDQDGKLLPDGERLPPFGKWLRSTSLDELPELFNILKGDMSIVGPRPLLVEYLPLYNNEQKHRHDVRPGLTGLAQVKGRNSLNWEEKFQWDIEYTKKYSPYIDVVILLETVRIVLRREGIHAEGNTTIEAFQGSGQFDK